MRFEIIDWRQQMLNAMCQIVFIQISKFNNLKETWLINTKNQELPY